MSTCSMVHKKLVGEDEVSVVISCFSGSDGSDVCMCMCSGHSGNSLLHFYAMVNVITN